MAGSSSLFSAHVANLGDNTWYAYWYFGDSGQVSGQTTIPVGGEADVTAWHSFGTPGRFSAFVKVVDIAGGGVAEASVGFTVVSASIQSIEFTSDHGVMKDGNLVDGGGALLPSPEWTPNGPSYAISQTVGTPLALAVRLAVQPADVAFTLTGNGANPESQFSMQGTSTGDWQTVAGTAAGNIPDAIYIFSTQIPWRLETGGVTVDLGTSGPHWVYCTYGLPRGDVTQSRVYWVVQRCFGRTDPQECVERIFAASPFVKENAWSPLVWKVPGYGGQCRDIAEFCLEAADMLGLPEGAGEVRVLYPYQGFTAADRPGSDGYDDNDRRTVTSPPHPPEHLAYIFPGDGDQHREWLIYKPVGTAGIMWFEACLKYSNAGATRWYAGGLGVYDDSQTVAKQILTDCVDLTSWAYLTAGGAARCLVPGPPVEHDWPK